MLSEKSRDVESLAVVMFLLQSSELDYEYSQCDQLIKACDWEKKPFILD